jgi:CubicO group peptidase (beta-lactamase class C family)
MISACVALLAVTPFVSCASMQARVPDASLSPDEVLVSYASSGGGSLPAVAAMVLMDGQAVWKSVHGTRRSGVDDPALLEDPFHIGSNTKAMTALLCAIFVDKGFITWQSTVGEILGGSYAMRDEYRHVTLSMLLSHTGGFPASLPGSVWRSFFPYDSPSGMDRDALTAAILNAAPAGAPGTKHVYSNFGYVIAGRMLEIKTGTNWETLMCSELFDPLLMSSAGFGPPAQPLGSSSARPAPWGHAPSKVDPGSAGADNPVALGPAGTVHASLADLECYLAVLLTGGLARDGSRIVSEESLAILLEPVLDGYGLGWLVGTTTDGRRYVLHDGSNTMFYSILVVLPDEGSAVVVLANRGDATAMRRVSELATYLASHFLNASLGE